MLDYVNVCSSDFKGGWFIPREFAFRLLAEGLIPEGWYIWL